MIPFELQVIYGVGGTILLAIGAAIIVPHYRYERLFKVKKDKDGFA